jgi:catechol 2,3-dioxygenase-like lactoylglutathione lyase family enzyme
MIKITICSVFVEDQDKALRFYTDMLGFVKKNDIPLGQFRWLTVASPVGQDGVELLLEPNENPAAKTYQASIYEQGIPATTFAVDDIQEEFERLTTLGVVFRGEPSATVGATVAVFEDTCGNLIGLHQVTSWRPSAAEQRQDAVHLP